ncbi:MAG: shikimate kinase [Lachnospiraceae bacterium]|nr:shikimate kinase [Lachnospiraceae bacterium]
MIIYLIGFMGVGKTTVGTKLAEDMGYEFVDTDEMIESKEGLIINEIFEQKGEDYFRKLETDTIKELVNKDNIVVSCGGGIIKNKTNVQLMKESGRVILLESPAEVIYERVKDTDNRPLLKGRNNIDGIRSLIEERQPLYNMAFTDRVNADAKPANVVAKIKELL